MALEVALNSIALSYLCTYYVSRCFTISRGAEKSGKEFIRYRYRMKFFRVFCGYNLTRSLSECKGVGFGCVC